MRRVFADAFWFIALLNRADSSNRQANELRRLLRAEVVTTWWVFVEVIDAFATSASKRKVADAAEILIAATKVRIVPPTSDDVRAGLNLFANRTDKHWSLSDCISFVVMRREGIEEALTRDKHFAQAGFRLLM